MDVDIFINEINIEIIRMLNEKVFDEKIINQKLDLTNKLKKLLK
jgi:hypothetical protein